MIHLGSTPSSIPVGWSVLNPATGKFDVQQAAMPLITIFISLGRRSPSDFIPYHAMKGDIHKYNDYNRMLNETICRYTL